jgi:hypothetical protein
MYHNIFDVKQSIESFGIWYALHTYGFSRIWTIWCATRMIARDREAQAEHANWHYR